MKATVSRSVHGSRTARLHLSRCFSVFVLLALQALCATPDSVFPTPGEWPCFRRTGSLEARSPLRGHIVAPEIRWKHFVGSRETLLAITAGDDGPSILVLADDPSGTAEDRVDGTRWGLAPPADALIGGRMQTFEPTSQVTFADVFPKEEGHERIEFETGFAKPTVNGQWQPSIGRCAAWRGNAWTTIWETDPIGLLFQALPIVGDFDGDGQSMEIAVLPWYELLILDAATGKVKDRCRFTEGRSYGFFGVYDLNGDGSSEFLVMADFAKHIEVLGYREGKLGLLWQRNIELDISNPTTILRVLPDPAADVTGKGQRDIVANVYNETGDGRWHALILDGMTGDVRFDLADQVVQDIADVDGDGVGELLTAHTQGRGLPTAGIITVSSLKDHEVRVLWQDSRARWALWEPPLPKHVNSTATRAKERVLQRTLDGHAVAALFQPADEGEPDTMSLQAVSWTQEGFRPILAATGPRVKALGIDAKGDILLSATALKQRKDTLAVTGGQIEDLGCRSTGVFPGSPAVVREGDRATIIVQGDAEEIVAFQAPDVDTGVTECWRRPGRGQGVDWPTTFGCVIGELNLGKRAVVLATSAPSGCARIAAVGLNGHRLWHHDFADIPGTPPAWNTGGIILWQTGTFTDPRKQDVLVTVRHSMMHSEETVLLDGRDGHAVWRRDRQISNRGVGGTHFALADMDGDGLEDAVSLHPSILYLLKGTTGHDILARDATWDAVPSKPVYWGLPIAGDFDGNGQADILFASERRSMTGLIRADGSLVWWDALDHGTTCYPAIGDVDGNGRLEIVGLGYDDGIRCYDATTGAVEWRLASPFDGTPAGTATADVNSDGCDEVLVTQGRMLVCLGAGAEGRTGQVLWQLGFPARLGPPAIADLEGNGQASIVVTDSEGWVYAVH